MTNAAQVSTGSREWVLGDPWWWIGMALGAAGTAWLWMRTLGDTLPSVRYGLVLFGLLAAGAALTIRLRFTQTTFLERLTSSQRSLLLLVLAGLFAMMAVATTLLLVLAFLQIGGLPYRWGQLLLWWIVVVPISVTAATQCWRRLSSGDPLSSREEGAVLCLLAGLVCFACMSALFDPADPLHMDMIRLFLGVTMLVALVAAPLVLVPQTVRRRVVSLLIVLHFGGIATAGLVSPPTPLALSQLWTRIYRPYLEFTYLINAYHFYAPEPGPTSYLWFRIQYENGAREVIGEWLKVPDLDEQGRHPYSTGLSYQRHVALTENTLQVEPTQTFYIIQENGQLAPAPFYYRRVLHLPQGGTIVGKKRPSLEIPWHPEVTQTSQYQQPLVGVKKLLESYARHVCADASQSAAAKMPGFRVKSVKIYRVVHLIPPTPIYMSGVTEPNDPDTYRPIFLGEYDTKGELLDPEEPFLYWILPTIKVDPWSRTSRYRSYALKHAGDPNWVRDEQKQWVSE